MISLAGPPGRPPLRVPWSRRVVTGQTEPVVALVFAGRDNFENWAVQRSRLAWMDPLEALGKREKVIKRVPLGVFFSSWAARRESEGGTQRQESGRSKRRDPTRKAMG